MADGSARDQHSRDAIGVASGVVGHDAVNEEPARNVERGPPAGGVTGCAVVRVVVADDAVGDRAGGEIQGGIDVREPAFPAPDRESLYTRVRVVDEQQRADGIGGVQRRQLRPVDADDFTLLVTSSRVVTV